MLEQAGFRVVNLDVTIGLERPKLAPHIPAMRQKVARALGMKIEQISIKAKTGEGIGAIGRGKAIRADAVALIERVTSALE